jgi:hypothetical protein
VRSFSRVDNTGSEIGNAAVHSLNRRTPRNASRSIRRFHLSPRTSEPRPRELGSPSPEADVISLI